MISYVQFHLTVSNYSVPSNVCFQEKNINCGTPEVAEYLVHVIFKLVLFWCWHLACENVYAVYGKLCTLFFSCIVLMF